MLFQGVQRIVMHETQRSALGWAVSGLRARLHAVWKKVENAVQSDCPQANRLLEPCHPPEKISEPLSDTNIVLCGGGICPDHVLEIKICNTQMLFAVGKIFFHW